jgi:hypothetical protein
LQSKLPAASSLPNHIGALIAEIRSPQLTNKKEDAYHLEDHA